MLFNIIIYFNKNMSLNKIIFLSKIFILLYLVNLSYELNNEINDNPPETIELSYNNNEITISDNCYSKIYKVINNFGSNNFLLINTKSISHRRGPYLYITNNENFNVKNDNYDYTLIHESSNGNKIALPQDYSNTFYLKVSCQDSCQSQSIYFDSVEEIDINEGEKFYFNSKDKDYSFNINVNSDIKNFDIALIITGENINQISMEVNGKEASLISEKVLSLFLIGITTNKITTQINAPKDSNFIFYFQILKNDDKYKNLDVYLNEDHYYYLLPNTNINFNLKYFNKLLTKKYELSISSFFEFNANIFNDEQGYSKKKYKYK